MTERHLSPGQRTLIDLGPLIVFFCANYLYGIMIGTAALMVATAGVILFTLIVERSIPPMPTVTCILVMIFGGLTLYFDNEIFIKVKPTIVNLLFATALTVGLLLEKNFLKPLLGRVMQLTNDGWKVMSKLWIIMFVSLAIVNEVLWRNVDTDTWVTFKAFGIPVIVLVFGIFMTPILQKHQLKKHD
jgi:intracellular septation protein